MSTAGSLIPPRTQQHQAAEPAAPNAVALARQGRRDRLLVLSLLLPAGALLLALLIIPVGWLFYLSLIEGGEYSLVHYERIWTMRSYQNILWTTVKISVIVTVICAVVGYPTAYLLAQLPGPLAAVGLAMVMIPFWISILVRTYAWLILLGARGPIVPFLQQVGLTDNPFLLLYNETGTIIGMVHVMLPFFILPLYANLRSFDWNLMHAAASMGAPPTSAFFRVFLPMSLAGIWAGVVLVFVQSIGFYVTPALLGGGRVTMVSMKIASNIQEYFDWGAASALGVVLLVIASSILILAARLIGGGQLWGTTR